MSLMILLPKIIIQDKKIGLASLRRGGAEGAALLVAAPSAIVADVNRDALIIPMYIFIYMSIFIYSVLSTVRHR